MSGSAMPARARALGTAAMGPMPMISGGTPATEKLTKRARGCNWNCLSMRSETRMTAPAPSDICELLPAVTLPPAAKTGLRRASASREVSGRGPSSVSASRSVTRTAPLRPSGRCLTMV